MNSFAVICGGGSGTRMGRPKQFLPLAGRPMIEWSIRAFLQVPDVAGIALVLPPQEIESCAARLRASLGEEAWKKIQVVAGGETRMASVRAGFGLVPEDADVVAIHDGARPLVRPETISEVLDEAHASGAALPAAPVRDTLKKVANKGLWVSTTPLRSMLWAAQTPQCYRREVLAEALARFPSETRATDESQLVERAGHKVKIVPSSPENIKVTYPEDLAVSDLLLRKRLGLAELPAVGIGYDIHRLEPGRELWLAGVKLDHPKGLLGHSDGDVVLHAAADAVLGALGEGEIGLFFPPENPSIKGIPSREIVAKVMELVKARGARLVSLDAAVVAEEPRLAKHYPRLRASLAEIFGLPESRANIKAKSHEGLGPEGTGLAVTCHAAATVLLPAPSPD